MNTEGRLYLCATPIGNLEDITLRVLHTLQEVDWIAAEDTRHSRILLDHYGITTPLTSYHEHNRFEKARVLVKRMQEGASVALICDAGTPGISDPGEELVRQCWEAGLAVTPLPGACAGIAALTMSGLSTRRFVFEGFLPTEGRERRQILERLRTEPRTAVIYEAPHRIAETLRELRDALGDRRVVICRELTKKYEEGIRTTLRNAAELYQTEKPRGEFVLVLEGGSPETLRGEEAENDAELSLTEQLQGYLDRGWAKKEAMRQMARERNCSRREIYQGLLREGERCDQNGSVQDETDDPLLSEEGGKLPLDSSEQEEKR